MELVTALYAIHPVGGPLHAVLDDWNLDGVIEPWYRGYSDEELDRLWYDGWPVSDLDPAAPAVTKNLGASTRQICDEIAATLNGWTSDQRYAAMAYADRMIEVPA